MHNANELPHEVNEAYGHNERMSWHGNNVACVFYDSNLNLYLVLYLVELQWHVKQAIRALLSFFLHLI